MTKDIDDLIARLPVAMHRLRQVDSFGCAQDVSDAAAALREQRDKIARWQAVTARKDPDDCAAGIKQLFDNWKRAEAERDLQEISARKYRSERDAAIKDAERINWLDKNPREATIRIGGDMKACVFYGVSCDPKWTAREAIDAAMKEKS